MSETEKADFQALLSRIAKAKGKPDQADMDLLKKNFEKWPEIAQRMLNLSEYSRDKIIKGMATIDLIAETALKANLEQMRKELAGDNPTPLEVMLVELIMTDWLVHFFYTKQQAADNGEGMTLPKAEFWEKRLLASQKRYLRSVTTLARIRKLQQPTPPKLQQVNISNGAAAGLAALLKPNKKIKV
jgi:hypothetical protein